MIVRVVLVTDVEHENVKEMTLMHAMLNIEMKMKIVMYIIVQVRFIIVCVTEQHYVLIFFTLLWSVRKPLLFDAQNP